MVKAMINDQKDEYPCIDCGEMVDVEIYCETDGQCKSCSK